MNTYLPGSHVIATLESEQPELLRDAGSFKQLIDRLVVQYDLRQLGEVYHAFTPGGFTGIVCLSESHISIHTWPEFRKVNLDIYLSNYLRENDGTVQAIFETIVAYFEARVLDHHKIKR
ncbi:S-adenosylmethionine decarboxylase family protein [Taibaiella chishuiensis]|uniref:S-adenosylmethionine decarboxylase n=1 Tax=Taibaiella chishuiensis TaxID=1434707 RepID=A0A2P8CZQ7_9BACT|nr:S-adenosylmethionine decarboxylase [Taibaiella chishuiensis]PSK90450.1 S-adenosylmethionine decarboxylase [Taibaiella chishuiensis]